MSSIRERGLARDCTFTAMRSSGPGGQNVNKVATKVELAFHVMGTALLSEEEKQTISEKLSTKINEEGYLKINDSSSRSQAANREAVLEKFYHTIEKALIRPKKRRPTKISKAVKEKIKVSKIKMSEKKTNRKISQRDWS
jgi:ribosome-associated protein